MLIMQLLSLFCQDYTISIINMSLILYSQAGNPRASKILIAAELLKVPLEHKLLDHKDLKGKEFLAKHPLGKVPLLDTPQGPVFESFTILRYIARKAGTLYGQTPFQRAQVETWLDSCLLELDQFTVKLVGTIGGHYQSTRTVYNNVVKELRDWCKILDSHLKDKSYLVGNSISIADIAVASYIHYLLRLHLDQKSRSGLVHMVRWFNQISSLPPFKSVLGVTWCCQKQFQPIFLQQSAKQETKAVQKVQKTEREQKDSQAPTAPKTKSQKNASKPQQKKEEKKKEEKKKANKKEQSDQEEEDTEAKQEKKTENPLDMLPKSDFNLDEFKRDISNTADKKSALKTFWTKFDPNGWSLWRSAYEKYEGEGTVGYLTCNLKNGFLRNIDHFRKYAFAAFGVYGTEGCYDIRGVWVWRGTEIPQQVSQHQSYDYYKFTRLDPNNQADRDVLQDYWLHLEEGQVVQGKPVYEVKYFK